MAPRLGQAKDKGVHWPMLLDSQDKGKQEVVALQNEQTR